MRTDETNGRQDIDSDEETLKALDAQLTAAFRRSQVDLDDLVAAMHEPQDEIPPADLDALFVDGEAAHRDPPPRRADRAVAPAILPRRRSFLARHRTLLVGTAIVLLAAGGITLKVGIDPIVAAGQGLVRLALEGPAARQKVVIEEISPDRLPDPLAALAPDTREALTDKLAMPIAQPFKAALITTPDRVCEVLSDMGLPNYGWLPVAEGSPVYECVSDLVPIPNPAIAAEAKPERTAPSDLRPEEDGDGTTAAVPAADTTVEAEAAEGGEVASKPQLSSFFFSARGRKDRIESIRFKLNLNDPTVRTEAIDKLIGFLDRISPMISWSRPEDLKPAVQKRKRISNRSRGVLYQVLPEQGAVERINVVVILTEPAQLPKPDLVIADTAPTEPPTPVDPAASLPLPQGVTPAFALAPIPGQELDTDPVEPAEPLPDGAVGPLTPVAAVPLPAPGDAEAAPVDEAPGTPAEGAPAPAMAARPGEADPAEAEETPAPAEQAVPAEEPAPAANPTPSPDVPADPAAGNELGALIDTVDRAEPVAAPPPAVLPPPRPTPPAVVAAPQPSQTPQAAAPLAGDTETPGPASGPPVADPAPTVAQPAADPLPGVADAAPVVSPPRDLPSPVAAPVTSQRTLPAPVTSFSIPLLDGSGEAPGLPGVKF